MRGKLKRMLYLMIAVVFMAASLMACGRDASNQTSDVDSTDTPSQSESEPSSSEETEDTDESDSDDDANADTAEIVPEEGASLKLWFDNDTYNEKIVELWNKKYPDIPLVVENVGTIDSRAKIELDGPAGQGADVFVQAHDGVAISAQSGTILEVDKFTDKIRSEFLENAIDAASYQGKVYGFPLSMKTILLFYNKELVDEPADTWDEIKEFAKEYNDPAANKFAMVWQAVEPYYVHGFLAGYGYEIFGPTHDDPNQLGWDTPEAAEGLAFYKTLRDEVYPVAAQDATWDAMNTMFSAGEAPYAITGPWSIADFKEAGVDFGAAPLPKLPNGNRPITLSTVDVVCVSSFTKYPNAAMLLADFITTDPECIKLLYETKNELTAHRESQQLDFYQNDPYMPAIAEAVENSLPQPYIPEMANVWAPYQKAIIAVWDGLQTPEEALKAAQEEFYSSLVN